MIDNPVKFGLNIGEFMATATAQISGTPDRVEPYLHRGSYTWHAIFLFGSLMYIADVE